MAMKKIIVGTALALVLILVVMTSATVDLLLNKGRYDRVVERARALTSDTTKSVYFQGDWDFDISPGPPPEAPNICAGRSKDGTLFVRITVKDRHRLGKYGFVYSEFPYASAKEVERALDMHDCGEWRVTGSIGASWWEIKNNLG